MIHSLHVQVTSYSEQRRTALLNALCIDYTDVYLCDLKKDTLEILKQGN